MSVHVHAQVIDLGYKPRTLQTFIHRNLKRFNVLVCHRRFGKTYLVEREMVDKGLRNPLKNPQYAYIAPTYGQAKRVAWEYLKDFVRHIPGVIINEADLRIDIPRPDRDDKVRFILLGAENPDAIRGMYFDGVVMDEFAQCDPILWGQVVRPALSDRKGWAIFIGTPKGQNHFYDIFQQGLNQPDWFVKVFKASETGVIDAEELAAARATMTEEEYEQEYECSFSAALLGSYYGKYMNEMEQQKRICNVPYDRNAMVSTYWDLGISDTTAIWFLQVVGREVHAIDYLENAGVGLEWYVRELKEKGYIYEDHWIPHDGAARELGSGKTRQETLREMGMRTKICPKQSVADGIHAVRLLLPKMWVDKEKCKRGIDCLKNYQRKWDSKNKMFVDKPLHDWSSNGSDALRQAALVLSPERAYNRLNLPRNAEGSFNALG